MNNKVVNIEYHAVCPACGASNGGREICEYCGANLIKNKSIEDITDVYEEEQYMQEDMGLPEVYGKSCDMGRSMTFFWLLFGGLFFIIPTVICIGFIMFGMMRIYFLLFFGIFWAIGLGVLIPVFKAYSNRKKCMNGQIVSGIVRDYESSMITVNGRPMLKLRVRVDDVDGSKILIIDTGETTRRYPKGMYIKFRNYGNYYMICNE